MSQEELRSEIIEVRSLIMKDKGWQRSLNTLANAMPNKERLPEWSSSDFVTGENHVEQSGVQVVAIVMMLQIVNSPA